MGGSFLHSVEILRYLVSYLFYGLSCAFRVDYRFMNFTALSLKRKIAALEHDLRFFKGEATTGLNFHAA